MKTVGRDRPLTSRATGRRTGPQALGLLVLFLSFLIIYHGTEGVRMLKNLDVYLSGAGPRAQTVQAPAADPSTALRTSLQAVEADIRAKAWGKAGTELQAAEGSWLKVQDVYARSGVQPVDLNGLTGDLAELQMAIVAHNAQDALNQVLNAEKTFDYMIATRRAGTSPSLDQMSQVVADLNAALKAGDTPRAKADAQALADMLSSVRQGF